MSFNSRGPSFVRSCQSCAQWIFLEPLFDRLCLNVWYHQSYMKIIVQVQITPKRFIQFDILPILHCPVPCNLSPNHVRFSNAVLLTLLTHVVGVSPSRLYQNYFLINSYPANWSEEKANKESKRAARITLG